LDAVEDFLTAKGYTNLVYTDGYQPDTIVQSPHVAVSMPPTSQTELQLGRGDERTYTRLVTINAYMENEGRASDVVDALMEFLDEVCVVIRDHTGAELGTMIVYDTESIRGEVIPPIMNVPEELRWRGTAQGRYESYYP
jgi:hypothetical protein